MPDLVGPGLRLLFVGINPGLWTAATATHFAHPGNRFYPALRRAGVIERDIDRGVGMTDDDRAYLIGRGHRDHQPRRPGDGQGVGALDGRAARRRRAACSRSSPSTIRWSSPSPASRPTAPRSASATPPLGRQPEPFGGAVLWVVPNPSGLNAHETIDTWPPPTAQPAVAAGIVAP